MLFVAVTAIGFALCALLAAWFLAGVHRRRPWDAALFAALAGPAVRGPDQLGPAGGGLCRRARSGPTRAAARP